jgi:hypothetical protein
MTIVFSRRQKYKTDHGFTAKYAMHQTKNSLMQGFWTSCFKEAYAGMHANSHAWR